MAVRLAFGGGRVGGSLEVSTCLTATGGNAQDFETETFVTEPVPARAFYSIMPQNSGKDYKARLVDVAQTLMAGGPVGGNQGGEYVVEPLAFAVRGRDEDGAVPEVHGDGDTVGTLRAAGGGSSRDFIAFQGRGSNLDLGQEVTGTLGTNADRASGGAPMVACGGGDVTHTLTAEGHDASEDGTGRGSPIAAGAWGVRRLTPTECERLQGFPDGWTRIPGLGGWRDLDADEDRAEIEAAGLTVRVGKGGALRVNDPDGPRYKALGNSWAVPVVRWIGARLQAEDARSRSEVGGGQAEAPHEGEHQFDRAGRFDRVVGVGPAAHRALADAEEPRGGALGQVEIGEFAPELLGGHSEAQGFEAVGASALGDADHLVGGEFLIDEGEGLERVKALVPQGGGGERDLVGGRHGSAAQNGEDAGADLGGGYLAGTDRGDPQFLQPGEDAGRAVDEDGRAVGGAVLGREAARGVVEADFDVGDLRGHLQAPAGMIALPNGRQYAAILAGRQGVAA